MEVRGVIGRSGGPRRHSRLQQGPPPVMPTVMYGQVLQSGSRAWRAWASGTPIAGGPMGLLKNKSKVTAGCALHNGLSAQ